MESHSRCQTGMAFSWGSRLYEAETELLIDDVKLILLIEIFQVFHIVNIKGLSQFSDLLQVDISDKA
jgi:hypothetical protein